MNTTTPGRLRSMLIKTGAALAACTLITLSALGSAASAQADDIAEPTIAIVAPAEPTEATQSTEAAEAAQPAEPVQPADPAALAAPADPAPAAAATPVANNDVFSGTLGGNDLAPSQLYINDSDTAPTGLEIDDPAGEVAVIGGWVHIPIAFGTGSRTFNYRFTNALGTSNWATVTLVIGPGSTQPIAYDDFYATTNTLALAVVAPGVMANDDAAGASVTSLLDPAGEVLIQADGTFEYNPAWGFIGVKTFYYQLTANGLPSNWAKVSITVTAGPAPAAPVATDDFYQTTQGLDLDVTAAKGVLANDNSWTAIVFDNNDSTGEVTVSFDGALHYTPPAGFVGTKTFEYRIHESGVVSNWATVTIEVSAAPPVLPGAPIAVDDKYQTTVDTELIIGAPGVLANDSAGIVWWTGGLYSGTMTLQLNGSFVYTPDAGFTGTAVIDYCILNNGLTSNVATITIEVVDTQLPTLSIDPQLPGDTGTGTLAFTGTNSTWLAVPALSIFLLGTLALGYSAARRRRAGTV